MPQSTSQTPPLPPPLALFQMATGYWLSQALYVAAKLGIADLLKDGPKRVDQLAKASGAHSRSLHRLLRALASFAIFAETADGRFELTPMAVCLETDAPDSMRAMAIMLGEEHYHAWGDLLHSVKTGEIAFNHAYKTAFFDYLARHPQAGTTFGAAMTNMTAQVSLGVVMTYDFSSISTLLDIGGGHGTLLTAVLTANPDMKGILFDSPGVNEAGQKEIEGVGLAGRCEVVVGDFFKSVPSGADAILMKNVIHDWDDERSLTILKNCHKALPAAGKVILVEMVVPTGNEPSFAKLLDLNMLVISGGRERTEAEYRTLFESAGFALSRILATPSPMSVIEGLRR
jgi:hypothetical protein